MEIIAIFVMVAFAGVAAFFFWENGKLHKRIVSLDEQLREAQFSKSKSSKPSKSEKKTENVTTTDPELERDLDGARNEIKDLKKQVYDLKSESKGLKKQLKSATAERTTTAPDSEMLFELREQIAELSAENARLEDALEDAKSKRPAPKPEKREEPKPEPPPAAAAATSGSDHAESIRARYDKELKELRDEVRDLNRKLKSTASNVDKQRRRADNNDRAYKITQRQYDAAQERVNLLEAQLEHAGIDPTPAAVLEARAPEVSSEPAIRTPAAIAADKAAAEEEKAAAEAKKAAEAAQKAEKPAPPKPPATPGKPTEPTKEEPQKPAMPGAMVRKPANKPKPEVGSTTVLSPMALANAAKSESADAEEEEEGTTVHRAKPITAADLSSPTPAAATAPSQADLKQRDSEAYESGGHTAMLTPGALAKTVTPAEEKSEPTADESGGHTAVMSSKSLSQAVTGDQNAKGGDEPSDARETGEQTAILSASAFGAAESYAEESVADEDSDGGRRPSSGLFGMPADALKAPADEEADPVRSTQFAFPTQMVKEDDDDTSGTAKFAPVEHAELKPSRLGGGLKDTDNPADKPVPSADDADDDEQKNQRLGGGRLGDLDLGDIGSAIDDAWGDLDVD